MLWYIHFFLFTFVFRHEKHSYLLEASSNYVLRTYIDGIKLLIYSSEVLLPDSQCQWFYSLFPFIQEKQWPVLLSHYIWWFFPNLNALETWKLEKISNVLCTFSKILISIMVTGIDGENYLWGLLSCSFGCRTLVTFSLPGWFVFLHCWSTHLSSFFVGLVGLDIVRVQMWRLLSLWNDLFSPASTFNALINVESITMHYALSRIFNFIHFPIKTKKQYHDRT